MTLNYQNYYTLELKPNYAKIKTTSQKFENKSITMLGFKILIAAVQDSEYKLTNIFTMPKYAFDQKRHLLHNFAYILHPFVRN